MPDDLGFVELLQMCTRGPVGYRSTTYLLVGLYPSTAVATLANPQNLLVAMAGVDYIQMPATAPRALNSLGAGDWCHFGFLTGHLAIPLLQF